MPEVLVVADDLTGAADCGSSFEAVGLTTTVTLGAPAGTPNVDVLAVDASTRTLSVDEAAAETARLVARFAPSCPAVFKKIDSTLRGHVGAEIAAAFNASRATTASSLLVVTPAFPALGRTVRGGRLFVRGVPLEDTDVWRSSPTSGPPQLLSLLTDAGLRAGFIGLDVLRSGPGRLRAEMSARAEGSDALACDAETEEDLRMIVAAVRTLGRTPVWAGSAGLARPLAEALAAGRTRRTPVVPSVAQGPILFVVGSPSVVSREQVAALTCNSTVTIVPVPVEAQAGDDAGVELAATLASGTDVALVVGGPPAAGPTDGRTAAALGRVVGCQGQRAGALVLTGGDTARAVLQALGVSALRLVGAVEPGVPRSVSEGAIRLPVITKAGAFGDRETLIRCRQALRGEKGDQVANAPA